MRAILPTRADRVLIADRISAALSLIAAHSPVRYEYLLRDAELILVGGTPHRAAWLESARLIVINDEYVAGPDTTPAAIAMTLVHEGMHARLNRCGFGYDENVRPRIERLCVEAERLVARRMPDADDLADAAGERLDYGEDFWTDSAFQARGMETLETLGWPGRIGYWMGRSLAYWDRVTSRLTRA